MTFFQLFRNDLDDDRRKNGKVARIMRVIRERIMGTEEIAAAMMKALEVDQNGAVYVVHGNSPIIQWPAFENPLILSFLILGRILSL